VLADALGWAIGHNAIALHLHRERMLAAADLAA
jgi:hypothetical protein